MKIAIYNDWDHIPKISATSDTELTLSFNGEYRKGDIIEISELIPARFYVVQIDAVMAPSIVYITTDTILYPIPFYAMKENLNPLAFVGNRHVINIRPAEDYEINVYRNLSENTFDRHDVIGLYPHASANVETRGESVFAAQNAINGNIAHGSHGEWPYESWGINCRDDAEFRLDFGRPVNIREVCIYERSDFPHDNWWVKGTLSFSNGAKETLTLEKREDGSPQKFCITQDNVSWMTLGELIKADDPSPFPALTQIKVFGTESSEYRL
ncbi:carbohydrate-binding protein [Oribacterium sp. WCC10]|uniref:carbohydrate-binding protein n=1 Tax=Oribacterium sp. WCC10 TaxID=1855343 RepID=UPI0008E7D389|nr:carbohydrate-binding protein [Oribacterium sp. WCC10]SFG51129.1 hypothetical protein SAMN05216356_11142 [Oribacterium sp. WCC10]